MHIFRKSPSYLAHRNVTGKLEGSFQYTESANARLDAKWPCCHHRAWKWERSHSGCILDNVPYTQGPGPVREGLAFHTQTRTTSPQPLMGVCYSWQADREWNPTQVSTSRGGKSLCCKGLSPFPWWLSSAGQQQCPCLQGFPLGCHCSPCAATWLGCSSSTEGQEQHLLPPHPDFEVGHLAGPALPPCTSV